MSTESLDILLGNVTQDELPLDDGGLSAERARGIQQVFEGISAMQESAGLVYVPTSEVEHTVHGFVNAALRKDEVINRAKQFVRDRHQISRTIEVNDWVLEGDQEAREDRSALLRRWRNLNDNEALRRAQIIGENMTKAYEEKRKAENDLKDNQADSYEHFEENADIYIKDAVAEAQAKGIEIVYPPFTPALSKAALAELGEKVHDGFEVDGFYSFPGQGTDLTQNWERLNRLDRLTFVKETITYIDNGGELSDDELDSLVGGVVQMRGFEKYEQSRMPLLDYEHDYCADRIIELDEILAKLQPQE